METSNKHTERYLRQLRQCFRQHRDKREAHRAAREILGEASYDPMLLREALARTLHTPGSLARGHYPVIALPVAQELDFELVFNCWIPRPDRRTDHATKAIHHHGSLLLSTATVFGPGYEHWTFSPPEVVDPAEDRYRMRLLGAEPHPKHHVDFVDAQLAHLPLYPAALSVTLALWSGSAPTGAVDRLKRSRVLQRYRAPLKALAQRLRLTRALALNVIEFFDFVPRARGFWGMRQRVEFPLGSAHEHRQSVLAILQQTGNESLVDAARHAASRDGVSSEAAPLLSALARGDRLDGVLSAGHLDFPYAAFTRADITRALAAQE